MSQLPDAHINLSQYLITIGVNQAGQYQCANQGCIQSFPSPAALNSHMQSCGCVFPVQKVFSGGTVP